MDWPERSSAEANTAPLAAAQMAPTVMASAFFLFNMYPLRIHEFVVVLHADRHASLIHFICNLFDRGVPSPRRTPRYGAILAQRDCAGYLQEQKIYILGFDFSRRTRHARPGHAAFHTCVRWAIDAGDPVRQPSPFPSPLARPP